MIFTLRSESANVSAGDSRLGFVRSMLPVALLGCASPPATVVVAPSQAMTAPVESEPETKSTRVFEALSRGLWGWPDGSGADSCEVNPHGFSFSADGGRMTLEHVYPLFEGERRFVYELSFVGSATLTGHIIEGAEQLTPEGNPVVWDLILLDGESYCWRRFDWPDSKCSAPVRRCPDDLEIVHDLPTYEEVCEHVLDIVKRELGGQPGAKQPSSDELQTFTDKCVTDLAAERQKLEPDVFLRELRCVMQAQSMDTLMPCDPNPGS